jgi:hypothetical protein
MKRILAAGFGLAALMAATAQARPVSWPGGVTVMAERTGDDAGLLVHYTVDPRFSLGLRQQWSPDGDPARTQIVATRLLRRWNEPAAQANIYAKAALGVSEAAGRTGAADVEMMADWETRRWYVSAAAKGTRDGSDSTGQMKARVGVAPYLGHFGDLHTWLMLEADWKPERADPVLVRPLMRFFYDVHLFELGWSSDDELFAAYILRL